MRKHKKYIGIASLLVVVLIIFAVTSAPSAIQAVSTPRSLPIYSVERDDKCVSLTFDAAWGDVRVRQ